MATHNADKIKNCWTKKLKAVENRTTADIEYRIFTMDGKFFAKTWMSHGWKGNEPIGPSMLKKIRDQIGLATQGEFDDLIRCSMSREAYLSRARPR